MEKFFKCYVSNRRNEVLVQSLNDEPLFLINDEQAEKIINETKAGKTDIETIVMREYRDVILELATPFVVNKGYGDCYYRVSLHNYDETYYFVQANCPQDALDELVDYLQHEGQFGFFYTDAEWHDSEKGEGIVAGNQGWYLDPEHTHLEVIDKVPSVALLLSAKAN